nr:MAG TPA: PIN domain [Caudoviricetes sp.]
MQRVVLDTCALIYLFLDHPHIPKAKSYADSVEFVATCSARYVCTDLFVSRSSAYSEGKELRRLS